MICRSVTCQVKSWLPVLYRQVSFYPYVPSLFQAVNKFRVRKAAETAEYRAAAFLRAASFYTYSPDRSQYAARVYKKALATAQESSQPHVRFLLVQLHQRMKADGEWAAIEAKTAGTDSNYKVVSSCVAQAPLESYAVYKNAISELLAVVTGSGRVCC